MEAARQSPVRPWLKREVRQCEGAASVTLVRRSVAAALLRTSAGWCVTWFQETFISVCNAAASLFAVVTCSFYFEREELTAQRLNISHPSDKEPGWSACWVDKWEWEWEWTSRSIRLSGSDRSRLAKWKLAQRKGSPQWRPRLTETALCGSFSVRRSRSIRVKLKPPREMTSHQKLTVCGEYCQVHQLNGSWYSHYFDPSHDAIQ